MPVDIANLEIIKFPNPILRAKAAPIDRIDAHVAEVAQRMIELMREAEGVGLAAPQVGMPWRLFVAEVPPTQGRSVDEEPPTALLGPCVYINPHLCEPEGDLVASDEGCLSLPDINGEILRPPIITINATGLDGKAFTQRGADLLARCWQHEYDHLDGVLIIDRMTQLSRLKVRTAVRTMEKEAGIR